MKKILLLLFVCFELIHAGNYGKIKGIVKGDDGDPLENVIVRIENTYIEATTDSKGFYSIIGIPVGIYTISASFSNWRKQEVHNVPISPDVSQTVYFKMRDNDLCLCSRTFERDFKRRNLKILLCYTSDYNILDLDKYINYLP